MRVCTHTIISVFSYYNGSIDKAYWFYNKSDDEKFFYFSSGRFFDFEYKKGSSSYMVERWNFLFLIQKSAIASII